MSRPRFRSGDRVKLSAEGIFLRIAGHAGNKVRAELKPEDVRGTVLSSVTRTGGCVSVRFDHLKDRRAVHVDYLEIFEDCAGLPDIAQMKRDLQAAGWTPSPGSVWKLPPGIYFRGPAFAWKIMRGIQVAAVPTAPP